MSGTDAPLDGVLPVDKPAGPSSHDMVSAVRRALRTRRVGHTGTLDPFASGLLLICVGAATRLAEYLSGLDKQYHATVVLGFATDTDDHTGVPLTTEETLPDASRVLRTDVERVLAGMTGDVLQRPPAYSAKKRDGERAYAAARAGRPLALEPVPVHIDHIDIVHFEPPRVELDVACGSGTYIRAIARDLGQALGMGGHLAALRRTRVGRCVVDHAITPEQLTDADAVRRAMIRPADALAHLPRIQVNDEQRSMLRQGRRLRTGVADADTVVVLAGSELVAIARAADGVLHPRKVFA